MNYDLVFEGGGAKGMVFVGAMQEFEARGHTYDRLLGTSAGAITAMGLAAGYTSEELLATLSEKENDRPVFESFMGAPGKFDDDYLEESATVALLKQIDVPVVPEFIESRADLWVARTLMRASPNLFSLIERGGWFSADNFVSWLERKLDEGVYRGTGPFNGRQRAFSNMTLAEFFVATERDLSLIASDTTGGRMLVLNHRTAPDLPVVRAVRMSMSLPMVWPEVRWLPEWGSYGGKEITDHLLVDGGLLSNFPIELFVSGDDHVVAVMGEKKSDRIIGLLIDESLEVQNAPPKPDGAGSLLDVSGLQIAQRVKRLLDTVTGAHDKLVIDAFERLVLRLPALSYGTVEFDMTDERREALVAAGRNSMRVFLDSQALMPSAAPIGQTTEFNPAAYADRVAERILDF